MSALANASESSYDNRIQYTGPVEVTSIESLLKDSGPNIEREVVVEGRLVRQLSEDTFVLSDGNREIQIELDDDIALSAPINSSQKLRLFGEYESGNTPEIEVEHIEIL